LIKRRRESLGFALIEEKVHNNVDKETSASRFHPYKESAGGKSGIGKSRGEIQLPLLGTGLKKGGRVSENKEKSRKRKPATFNGDPNKGKNSW